MKTIYIKKGVDICNAKSMWEFLHNHYSYFTMNSWNGLKSVANNVKIYNLELDGDHWKALERLESDNYTSVNILIEDWEYDHSGYSVGFNGKSGGYLVLCYKNTPINILPNEIVDANYDEFKQYCKEYYGSVKNYMSELRYYTKLVRDFDRLCEELRLEVNEISKMSDEEWRGQHE